MRITSGKYKGRTIKMPQGIRPTQDKVRKALFDILGNIKGLSFLELFAGSGAVGFEAVSRGVKELVLAENSCACLAVIEQNIKALEISECALYPLDAGSVVQKLHKNGKKFDIIFLDPPYYQDEAKKALQILDAYDILAPYGLVVAQHFKKDKLPSQAGKLSLIKEAKYGDTFLSFYSKHCQ
jgi:16S rRNA (guanine966-N2)-methyltransferase